MNQEKVEDIWTNIPKPEKLPKERFQRDLTNDLLQSILSLIQDGVSIIDRELNVIYMNPSMNFWYPGALNRKADKCYKLYHNAKAPCDNCPVLRVFDSKRPETELALYEDIYSAKIKGWQRIFCMPIFDDDNEVIIVVEYVRDITSLRKLELATQLMEKQSGVLFDILEQQEKERKSVEQTIVNNVELSMKPILDYLENVLEKENIDMVKRQLDHITQGISEKKSYMFEILSPKELQVAKMIKDNYLSKQIADKLMISKKTVDYHRANIRKKLNLGQGDNLQKFLEGNL
jgi:hypothetical protein